MVEPVEIREFAEEEIEVAVSLIQERRPDLWARFIEHERKSEGFRDIAEELEQLLSVPFQVNNLLDMTTLLLEIKLRVRKAARLA